MLRNAHSFRFAFILMLMLSSNTLLAQQPVKSPDQPTWVLFRLNVLRSWGVRQEGTLPCC